MQRPGRLWQGTVVGATLVAYGGTFVLAHAHVGPAFSLVPVAFAAWWFGVRGGLVASVAVMTFMASVAYAGGASLLEALVDPRALPGRIVLVAAALGVGGTRRFLETVSRQRDALAVEARYNEAFIQAQSDLNVGVLITSGSRAVSVNDALCRMLGRSRKEILALPDLLALVPPGDRESLAARAAAESDAADAARRSEVMIVRPDGTAAHIEFAGKLLAREPDRKIVMAYDVTARVRAEAAVRESEARLRQLTETSFDGICIHENGVFREFNAAFAKVWGYAPGELMGRHILEFVDEESRRVITGRVAKPSSLPYIFAGRRKDGKRILLKVQGNACTYEGRPARIVAVQDITERVRAEQALQRSEALFREMAETVDQVFWAMDGETGALYVSPGYARLWGSDPAQLATDPTAWRRVIEPDDQPGVDAYLAAQRAGTACDVQYRIRRPDGTLRWVHDHAYPVRTGEGGHRTVGFASDITSLKEAEARWREASVHARGLFEATMDPMALVTAEGMIVDANDAMTRATGRPRGQLLETPFSSYFTEPADVERGCEEARAGGALRDRLVQMPHGEEPRHMLLNITSLPHAEGPRLLVAARDITDRVRLEQDAAAQREVMARNERLSALGTLVAGVAHEINNPLVYLLGNIELSLLDVEEAREAIATGGLQGGPDLAETTRNLETAKLGAERIAHITRALKAVARQRSDSDRAPVRVNDVLLNLDALLKVAAPEGVKLAFEPDPEDAVVHANAGELHQVALNLVTNALDAARAGGGTFVSVHARSVQGEAWIDVRDDGPGIPEDVRRKLFTPFFTTKPNGTGLGLSIVHGIVQAHGGDVEALPPAGKGATLRVRLPLVAPEPAAGAGATPSS